MNRFITLALDTIFPPACVSCGVRTSATDFHATLCTACRNSITDRDGYSCTRCGSRVPGESERCHGGTLPVVGAATSYHPVSQELIYAVKYRSVSQAIEPMAVILGRYVVNLITHHGFSLTGCAIVPIPVHPSRERTRGYNQALLLAERTVRFMKTETPILDVLVRVKETVPQIDCKNYTERERNLRGAFACNEKIETLPMYQSLILLDDVCTSGSTLAEAARTLRENGARRIAGLVFSKA